MTQYSTQESINRLMEQNKTQQQSIEALERKLDNVIRQLKARFGRP